MKLLAIDASGKGIGAALVADGVLLDEFNAFGGHNHSIELLPGVDRLLIANGLRLNDIDAFAVTVGPGSFTGLRIGIATVKAWGDALHKPLLAVSSLDAMARAAALYCSDWQGLICPIFDARRNEVYTARYRQGKRLDADLAVAPARLPDLLPPPAPVLFAGDALPVYADSLRTVLGERFHAVPADKCCFMAAAAAIIGWEKWQRNEITPGQDLLPVYLRLSEAEEKRLAQEGVCATK